MFSLSLPPFAGGKKKKEKGRGKAKSRGPLLKEGREKSGGKGEVHESAQS